MVFISLLAFQIFKKRNKQKRTDVRNKVLTKHEQMFYTVFKEKTGRTYYDEANISSIL